MHIVLHPANRPSLKSNNLKLKQYFNHFPFESDIFKPTQSQTVVNSIKPIKSSAPKTTVTNREQISRHCKYTIIL